MEQLEQQPRSEAAATLREILQLLLAEEETKQQYDKNGEGVENDNEEQERLKRQELEDLKSTNNMAEKREVEEGQTKMHPMFRIPKTRKKYETLEERIPLAKDKKQEIEGAEIDWEEQLEKRDAEMEARKKKRRKQEWEEKEQKNSYNLLSLCKEVMAKEGMNWTKSRDRREEELEKD